MNCSDEIPNYTDKNVKATIIKYLGNSTLNGITEEKQSNQSCYTFTKNEFEHKFCFNKEGLLSLAK